MRVQALFPRQAEFRTFRPKNVIVVENCADLVRIRAARDNFSERRKRLFVRHLAAEGFIPDRFEKLSTNWRNGLPGLEWVVAPPQVTTDAQPGNSALLRVLWMIFYSAIVWLGLMALAFWRSH